MIMNWVQFCVRGIRTTEHKNITLDFVKKKNLFLPFGMTKNSQLKTLRNMCTNQRLNLLICAFPCMLSVEMSFLEKKANKRVRRIDTASEICLYYGCFDLFSYCTLYW